MTAIRVVIEGRVQGVGYRAWVVREASTRGLAGWVRNLRDGRVEAVFSGHQSSLDQMIDACRSGPRLARVTNIESFPTDDEAWPEFSVRPTG